MTTGAATYEDANLILRLYELRREEKLRQARDWYARQFFPHSAEDVMAVYAAGHPGNAYLRMVTSYWDMAASFVTKGPLHAELFMQSNGEIVFVWSKLEPFIARLREHYGQYYLANVEEAIARVPAAAARIAYFREYMPKLEEAMKAAG